MWKNEITFRDGVLQMWNYPVGHQEERAVGWDGSYAFFKDTLTIEDFAGPLTFDFTFGGTTLRLSNMRGSCGDARAWTSQPWTRQ